MKQIARRTLLTGASASLAALPFLSHMQSAEAQVVPPRLLIWFTPNEAVEQAHWQPGANMALPDMLSPLEPHKSKINILGEMEMASRLDDPHPGGHIGIGHVLIGRKVIPFGPNEPDHFAGGISVDQYVADQLGVSAMVVGARPGGSSGNSRLSYTGPNEPVHPIDSPSATFDQWLGDLTLDPTQLAALYAQRRSVLDTVAGQLQSLESKISAADKHKLATHLDRVRDLELKLKNTSPASCTPTSAGVGLDKNANADYPAVMRAQADLVVQALACNVTRVATIQNCNSGASAITPNGGGAEGININVDAHNISHDYNTDPNNGTFESRRVELEKWYFRQFAYLLDQLDAVQEGDGTLLDNTLVVWVKPISHRHRVDNMLFITAGSAGGQLETGRYLAFPDVPHNNLLVNVCNLMGLSDQSFGDPKYCTGALPL